MYGSTGQNTYDLTHQNNTNSTIKTQLDAWYTTTTLGDLSSKIDVNTGFCNDRGLSEEAHAFFAGRYEGPDGGYGVISTAYAPADRVWESGTTNADTTQRPTLKCGKDADSRKKNLFTGPGATLEGIDGINEKIEGNNKLKYPVGLITMDEVIYAGGFYSSGNNSYWLCTEKYYWTMSPSDFYNNSGKKYGRMFYVDSGGDIYSNQQMYNTYGVRPVINLKADTKFTTFGETDEGTATNPFVPS